MTKEQLSQLSDQVRIPTELLLEHLKFRGVKPQVTAVAEDGGVAFFFENEVSSGTRMTADIEIHGNGEVSASVIPFRQQPDGWGVSDTEAEPVEEWEAEEAPPFVETVELIVSRLELTVYV